MLSKYTLVLLCAFIGLTLSLHLETRDLNAPFLPCYDYIIVGGGVSGLVVANRLTEDPNVSVLVLEAGDLDNYEDLILFPIEEGYGLGTKYDWNLWTVPQTSLDGAARPYNMGRGVGGGSLINGMCWTRGGRADYDAWVALGNEGWGWDDLLPYSKKSERYTNNVDADFSRKLYVQPEDSTHGADGYTQVSYSRYFYNQSQLFLDGLRELGIPILTDPNNGTAAGGMLIPDSISPNNQTRSSARMDYYDGFSDSRSNLHIASQQHVTRVLFSSQNALNVNSRDYPFGQSISGVEFVSNGGLVPRNVTCSREVILAAGAVHTPQILELSGIGSPAILNKFNIPVAINLAGVGNNFQDHPYVGVIYYYNNASYFNINMLNFNPTLLNQVAREYYANKTGPWTAGAINTVAFPSLPSISRNWTNMMADASSQNAARHLISGLDQTLVTDYEVQKRVLVELISRNDVGAYEILNDNVGLPAVAAMHTFSRGSVHIQSRNAFDQPDVDPRYCSNPLDCQVIVEGLLFNNQIVKTSATKVLDIAPYYPFLQDATPATLMSAVLSGIRTEFHGTGTTSMLPLELGGVVDTHLQVYGTKNLRIVDAGIFPLVPAAHLQAPVYAVAEKAGVSAADIIKADNAGLTPRGCDIDSSFAQLGPPNLTNLTDLTPSSPTTSSSSSPSPRPLASTFPEFLDSHLLINLTRLPNPSSALQAASALPMASGALFNQLLSSSKTDAILHAASIFLDDSAVSTSAVSIQAWTLRDGPLSASIATASLGVSRITSTSTAFMSGDSSTVQSTSAVTTIVVATMRARDEGRRAVG
ncbi:related to alcohol oxidase [Rhynchosporium agropyri]|uniref:Related to alcohol oxidase n=1 Tax=Rhynchosporium agropyri TaxID=914238 RepID=A0A1E1JTR7_9HELO|nr:related to alcohol oxidase [Rhynchosporium agropyri]